MRVWSELPKGRTREIVADLATVVWVLFWGYLGIGLYSTLVQLSSIGTDLGEAGNSFQSAGSNLERVLAEIPLVGEGAGNVVSDAFRAVGVPLAAAGNDLERLLTIIAAILGLLLVAIALIPWLNRYLPWRIGRWQRLNAGDRAINQSPAKREGRVAAADVERVLATRAMHRLEYAELLELTPDPIGDFVEGRYGSLAQAELESVGLRKRELDGG